MSTASTVVATKEPSLYGQGLYRHEPTIIVESTKIVEALASNQDNNEPDFQALNYTGIR